MGGAAEKPGDVQSRATVLQTLRTTGSSTARKGSFLREGGGGGGGANLEVLPWQGRLDDIYHALLERHPDFLKVREGQRLVAASPPELLLLLLAKRANNR